jgi:hypothetical protein
MRTMAAVTTFNREGYERCGRRMIESFDQYWPREIPLYCYAEGFTPDMPSPRAIVVDLLSACPELAAFKDRHSNNQKAHGAESCGTCYRFLIVRKKSRWRTPKVKFIRMERGIGYRWNAVRFSHKSFAIFNASARCKADVLYWLDADILVFDEVPWAFLEELVPPDHLLGYLKRPKFSECGFVGYNLRHPSICGFFAEFKALYTTDRLFREREYHDSWLFDTVRKRFERMNCKTFDIARGRGAYAGHVFINSPLGQYMDHMKGERWAHGSSSLRDLIVPRHEPYWTTLAPASELRREKK